MEDSIWLWLQSLPSSTVNRWKTSLLPSSSYQRFLQSTVLLSRRIKIQLQTLKKDFICKIANAAYVKFTRDGFYIYRCSKKLQLQCHLIVNSPPMLSLQNNKFKEFSEEKARMRMRAHAFIQENKAIQGIHAEELSFLSPWSSYRRLMQSAVKLHKNIDIDSCRFRGPIKFNIDSSGWLGVLGP